MSAKVAELVNPEVHIKAPPLDEASFERIAELRNLLVDEPLYQEYSEWCNDEQLQRFLTARQNRLPQAKDLTLAALKWRKTRIPPEGITAINDWQTIMKRQSETGSMFISGFDQYNRPIIILDNSVQNSSNYDESLTFVAFSLDQAVDIMPPTVDKYLVFFNLKNFSLFNCPPVKSCSETVFMLSNGYPERLGHLIVYKPPFVLWSVYNAFKVRVNV